MQRELGDGCGKPERLWCVTTVCLSPLYTKTSILPRQARDKHRENTQQQTVSLQGLPGRAAGARASGTRASRRCRRQWRRTLPLALWVASTRGSSTRSAGGSLWRIAAPSHRRSRAAAPPLPRLRSCSVSQRCGNAVFSPAFFIVY